MTNKAVEGTDPATRVLKGQRKANGFTAATPVKMTITDPTGKASDAGSTTVTDAAGSYELSSPTGLATAPAATPSPSPPEPVPPPRRSPTQSRLPRRFRLRHQPALPMVDPRSISKSPEAVYPWVECDLRFTPRSRATRPTRWQRVGYLTPIRGPAAALFTLKPLTRTT